MGTRGRTIVVNEDGEQIINLYRQYDSYPTGHGQELAEFLNDLKGNYNGAGDLAALLVSHFKKGPMSFYLYPTSAEDLGQDYEYWIYVDRSSGQDIGLIKIMDCGFNVFGMTQDETYEPLFEGNLAQFTKYCANEKYGDTELNQPFENSIVGQEVLKQELKQGVVTVVFEKNDGTDRVMKCTLSEDYVPALDTTAVKQKRVANPDVLAVWDIENDGWRSFRFDSIKSIQYPCVA
jgi:hypothetical protein